jgi:hypothetical protein
MHRYQNLLYAIVENYKHHQVTGCPARLLLSALSLQLLHKKQAQTAHVTVRIKSSYLDLLFLFQLLHDVGRQEEILPLITVLFLVLLVEHVLLPLLLVQHFLCILLFLSLNVEIQNKYSTQGITL